MPEAIRGDINIRAVAWTGVAILIMLALAGTGAYLAWKSWGPARSDEAPNSALDFRVPEPGLPSAPQADRAVFMAEKEKLLHSWQWIDPRAGIARIPIEEAMRIMASRGTVNAASVPPRAARREAKR